MKQGKKEKGNNRKKTDKFNKVLKTLLNTPPESKKNKEKTVKK